MNRLILPMVALAAFLGPAQAQVQVQVQVSYPSKPIRIINPYPPGGGVDIVARIVTEAMRTSLGQPIVLENKPGAFGIIAAQDLRRASADGYTLVFGNVNTHAVWPAIQRKKFPFDFAKEIIAVAPVANTASLLAATTKNFPPGDIKELIAYAQANPGKVRYSSIGVGSFPHLDVARLARRTGVEMSHIPTKGAAGMVQDLITGDAHIGFVNAATAGPLVKSGQLRAIAVITEERLPEFPEVKTMAEQGYADIGTQNWFGIFARTGTPPHVLDVLHKAATEAVSKPETQELFRKQSIQPFLKKSPDEARGWLQDELAKWDGIVKELDLAIE